MPKSEENSSNESNLATPRTPSVLITPSTPKCTTTKNNNESNWNNIKCTSTANNTTFNLNLRLFLGEQGKRVRFYRNGDQFFKVSLFFILKFKKIIPILQYLKIRFVKFLQL